MDLYSEESCDVHFLAVLSKFRIAKLYGRGLGMDDDNNKVYGKWGLPVFTNFRTVAALVAATSQPDLNSHVTHLPMHALSEVNERSTHASHMPAEALRVERRNMIPGSEIVTFRDNLKMSRAFADIMSHSLRTKGPGKPPEIMHMQVCLGRCKSKLAATAVRGDNVMQQSFDVMAKTIYELLKTERGLVGGSVVVDMRLYPRADWSNVDLPLHVDSAVYAGTYPPDFIPPVHYNKIILLYNESAPEHGTRVVADESSAVYAGSPSKDVTAMVMNGDMQHAQMDHTKPIPEGQNLLHIGVAPLTAYKRASLLQKAILNNFEAIRDMHRQFRGVNMLSQWKIETERYALVLYIAWDTSNGETRLKINIVPKWRPKEPIVV